MEVKEFKAFMDMIDEAYPKQKKLNKVQKGLFWLTLQDYSLENSLQALVSHTHSGEWKPQVCDLCKHLSDYTLPIIETFSNFFNGVEVKDKIALEVFKLMGGDRLRRTTLEKDYRGLELKFIDLYRQKATQKRMEKLPNKLKNKLIGLDNA
tara:strand:- start:74 stop:526 length:453 start_codon:yes stop_codon:yes gene_type:complete